MKSFLFVLACCCVVLSSNAAEAFSRTSRSIATNNIVGHASKKYPTVGRQHHHHHPQSINSIAKYGHENDDKDYGDHTSLNARGGDEEEDTNVNVKSSFLQRHPFASAVVITTINAVAADVVTQLVFERAATFNKARTLVFAAFGFSYQGCAQYAIVNGGWEKLFPGNRPRNILCKICGMNFLSDPLLFMPTFYIFKEALAAGTVSMAVIRAALLGYKSNALMDWRNSWMVWFPGHAVTYGVMKPHQRIPWMATLSFFYMCILSLTRGGG